MYEAFFYLGIAALFGYLYVNEKYDLFKTLFFILCLGFILGAVVTGNWVLTSISSPQIGINGTQYWNYNYASDSTNLGPAQTIIGTVLGALILIWLYKLLTEAYEKLVG